MAGFRDSDAPSTDDGTAGPSRTEGAAASDDHGPRSDRERAAAPPEDPELVAASLRGDRAAFSELVARHQRPLFYVALRYLKNEADAADVTQRAFVRMFSRLETFRGDASFRTWAYRITINLALNHIRDHKRETVQEIRDDALRADAVGTRDLERARRAEALRAAVEDLPPKQRMVIELRIYDELPFKEVAALADCSENAAKVNFHHGMKRLRAQLGPLESMDDGGDD